MKRIERAFEVAKREERAALIIYVCAGDPSLEATEALVPRLAAAGADIIELGVPFSDPIADGPVIQGASERALKSGTTLRKVLAMVKRLRGAGVDTPLALMSYLNPIHTLGDVKLLAEAGADAVIIPDLPLDEAPPWRTAIAGAGMDLIALAAPTTSPERLSAIGAVASGFLYYVSVTGVTGARSELPPELPSQLAAARRASSVPVAVGFGIETPEQARALALHADAVIVGSAIVKALLSPGGEPSVLARVTALSQSLKGAHPPSLARPSNATRN